MKAAPFTLMNVYLYKLGPDNILRRCSLDQGWECIMDEAHASSMGHHSKKIQ
jgi:hypothetical protein